MGKKEKLTKEYTEWTVKYIEADNRLKSLLPNLTELSKGEKLQPFTLTKESVAEFASAKKEVDTALAKLREILDTLSDLR